MYRCAACGHLGDNVSVGRELIDGQFYETASACEICGSDELEEVYECEACHVDIARSGSDYCAACERDLELLLNEVKTAMGVDETTLKDMIVRYVET